MTLPFRRRHHDGEATHDRARVLTSSEMLAPLASDEQAWLSGHLAECGECRRDRDAYLADRELLRALRDRTPEPPRDLWARTSAALDREGSRRGRGIGARGRRDEAGSGLRRSSRPFGAAAGALIVLVVVGVSFLPRVAPPTGPDATPGGTQIPQTADIEPTPFPVSAGRLGWVRAAGNGSWELVMTEVDGVCPRTRPSCQRLIEDDPARTINLGSVPTGITISPTEQQLVVEKPAEGTAPDRILVVPVPPLVPIETPAPTVRVTATSSGAPVSAPPSPDPSPTNPDGAIEIASGVTVVGEAAYSTPEDGTWLAFSARPSDGSTGPDLYLWTVGMSAAMRVTDDHRTYFSSWLDGQVLASRVNDAVAPEPGETGAPGNGPTEAPTAAPTAESTDAAGKTPSAPVPVEAHPSSFLLDPTTLVRTELAQPDLWLPVVDPTGRFVAFWSGTLIPTADGLDWHLATGQLVLDGWSNGATAAGGVPTASGGPESSDTPAEPTDGPSTETDDPASSPTPFPGLGPTGTPVAVVTGPTAAFKAKFDPTGGRLAIWAGEQLDATVGRLHLIVIDPATGVIDLGQDPLPGAPALKRFSIAEGRLAWVSPSGQDGQESAVQVLGWSDDEFGEIRTVPAKDLFIVR